tara:strand:+ start:183 stop:578 length:396 start_codon:yes stop_codon:yes gene_type:complete
MANTRKKKKAKLSVEMNLKNSKTSFADYGAKEILKDFTSSTIGALAMTRNEIDYTLCDIVVLYKGRINLQKGKDFMKLVPSQFYVYSNVDITVWREIRKQALIGNSMGKAIGKHLVESNYEYSKVTGLDNE